MAACSDHTAHQPDLSTRGFFPHIAKYRLFTQIEIALYTPTYLIFNVLIA